MPFLSLAMRMKTSKQKVVQIPVRMQRHFPYYSQDLLTTVGQQKFTRPLNSIPIFNITDRGTDRLLYNKQPHPAKHGQKFSTALPYTFLYHEIRFSTGHPATQLSSSDPKCAHTLSSCNKIFLQ